MTKPTSSPCVCANCVFATPGTIPDPATEWKPGMRQKPRVSGFRCHIHPPAQSGFAPVFADSFCAFFTDRATHEQPLRHFAATQESGGVR